MGSGTEGLERGLSHGAVEGGRRGGFKELFSLFRESLDLQALVLRDPR